MIKFEIIDVKLDPYQPERLKTGNFRVNKELNEEWIDIKNTGDEPINLRGRVLASHNTKTLSKDLVYIFPQRALIASTEDVPLFPGEVIRIFSGEQPYESTYIPDEYAISRVIWLVRQTYLWVNTADEARIYLDMETLRRRENPLAIYKYNPWFGL